MESFFAESAELSKSSRLVRMRANRLNASSGESLMPCSSSKHAMIMPVRPLPPLQ